MKFIENMLKVPQLSTNNYHIQSISTQAKKNIGIAFDIDGVLIRGKRALPGARTAIQTLERFGIPYIFLTNGGGIIEKEKAQKLGEILEMNIDPLRMVQSHTPMQSLAPQYKDSKVLILGSKNVMEVAKTYGFNKVVSVKDLARSDPRRYPFIPWDNKKEKYGDEEIKAIMIFHDPIDWAPDLQIAVDVLRAGNPVGSGHTCKTQTPLFTSNDDFTFSGEYPVPRFAAGAFTRCLSLLYEEISGTPIKMTKFGKPHKTTYRYAEDLLDKISKQTLGCKLDRIYGIGDNPHSDIKGANDAGERWSSILVRTGIFTGKIHPTIPADYICDNVEDALNHILEKHS